MRTRSVWLLVLSLLLFPAQSSAQDVPAGALSAGYASVYDFTAEVSYPVGWYAAASGNPWERVGLEFEVSQQIDSGFKFTSFLAGPRVMLPLGDRVVPHLRALVGPVRYSRGTVAWNSGVLQVGAGLDVYLTERVGVRIGGDVRWGFSGEDPTSISVPPRLPVPGRRNAMRFSVGVLFGLGHR